MTAWDRIFVLQCIFVGLIMGIGVGLVSVGVAVRGIKNLTNNRLGIRLIVIGLILILVGFGWLFLGGFDWGLSLASSTATKLLSAP